MWFDSHPAGVTHAIMGKNAGFWIKIADTWNAHSTHATARLFGEIDFLHAA
ncbi:hypothetical protein LTSESEN_1767 [Salmonella enterica subsp. enterica serovar Senftenberg str. A4-543]|uniref:Uncharacterized protein n=1 Tax=Salmonella enterica subsp. enterica serovar Senftenberg str. A4-543 TaxID=913082 RepID=G5QY72_SALSE|nr:hypothetical protein LTSESEN_1767 [Salmonella enterica subsp. enterica serovar Senftenberg str. A4-543]